MALASGSDRANLSSLAGVQRVACLSLAQTGPLPVGARQPVINPNPSRHTPKYQEPATDPQTKILSAPARAEDPDQHVSIDRSTIGREEGRQNTSGVSRIVDVCPEETRCCVAVLGPATYASRCQESRIVNLDVDAGESARDGHWGGSAEVVTLSAFPSLGTEDFGLCLGFDSFGDAG